MPAPDDRLFRVELRRPGLEPAVIEMDGSKHIFDAARAAGIDLPYSCLQGWCLSCAARVVSGTVDQQDSRRFYNEDREAGFALLCTGRPRSDLIVETHARDAMRAARTSKGLPFPRGDWGTWER